MDASTRLSWRRVCWSPPGWLWTRREAIDFALKIKLRNVIVRLLPFPFIRRSTTFSREKDDGIWAQLHSILVDSFLKDQQYTKRRCKLKIFNGFPIIFPLFSHCFPMIFLLFDEFYILIILPLRWMVKLLQKVVVSCGSTRPCRRIAASLWVAVTGQRDPLGNPDYRWDDHPIQFFP